MLKKPQAKGKRAEYSVRDILRNYGYKANRTPLSGSLDGWPGDITSDFPLFIEVKNTETTTFLPWFKKASDEASPRRPVIIWTKNSESFYCFLSLYDFLDLLTGKPMGQLYAKSRKAKKVGIEETAGLKFSKLSQLHRRNKP